ncbi:MAG: NAD(P)/FAD-dependent oxidoreductase [Myxococcales bacterium]|nr:MAG: NAD(P)/FAD-dependent oxidoreductase [Myxococcales bacterium]
MATVDALIVGAGHNGLVAAIVLARAGLSVRVLEAAEVVGGACRTEYPFEHAPGVGQSTGAYLLGLMPPELMRELGISLPLLRRDPHYFLPTTRGRFLLMGRDRVATEAQLAELFSERDVEADRALQGELSMLREDIAPAWLEAPLSIEATAEHFVRPALRETFVDLCRGSVSAYLARFGFESELLEAMYAVTDGFTGLCGSWDTPGGGMNFLAHNMCRLPGSDGTWMVVRGGMGTVTRALAERAMRAGVDIVLGKPVDRIETTAGVATGVATTDGEVYQGRVVVVGADPFRILSMLGDACPDELRARIDGYHRPGTSIKVNLCLSDLPTFSCLPERRGQHRATIHLLPEKDTRATLSEAFAQCEAGRLPTHPSIEWYIHTTLDPSLQDDRGRHSAALFCQWVPYELAESSWDREEAGFVARLLEICECFAPGTSALVEDVFTLTPPKIESHFGITQGHIHHVDNSFGFADRLPYRLPVAGLYACGAGCHPAGSVIGAAGHNAAATVLSDLAISS